MLILSALSGAEGSKDQPMELSALSEVEGSKFQAFFVNYNMEKRKLSKSKVTGKTPPDDGELFSVIVNVREPDYVPAWVPLRTRITSHIFTTDVKLSDISKLEADNEVISVAINQRMDQL